MARAAASEEPVVRQAPSARMPNKTLGRSHRFRILSIGFSASGSVALGVAIVVEDFFDRARREEGAYPEYATDEQRRLGEKRSTGMVMNGATDPPDSVEPVWKIG